MRGAFWEQIMLTVGRSHAYWRLATFVGFAIEGWRQKAAIRQGGI